MKLDNDLAWAREVIAKWNDRNRAACTWPGPEAANNVRPMLLRGSTNAAYISIGSPMVPVSITSETFSYVARPATFGQIWKRRVLKAMWKLTKHVFGMGIRVHPIPEMAEVCNPELYPHDDQPVPKRVKIPLAVKAKRPKVKAI